MTGRKLRPPFDFGKWDHDHSLAALTLQFQSLPSNLGNELSALATGLYPLRARRGRRFGCHHEESEASQMKLRTIINISIIAPVSSIKRYRQRRSMQSGLRLPIIRPTELGRAMIVKVFVIVGITLSCVGCATVITPHDDE